MREPTILTDEDFADSRLGELTPCTLVIAHANLIGTTSTADEDAHSDARDFLAIALDVAEAFPELRIGLLNCLDYPDLAEKLSVYVSEFGIQCAAFIFTQAARDHSAAPGYGETYDSFRDWLLGILLAHECRYATSREEICVRLAYDLVPPSESGVDEQWDDREVRTRAITAAQDALAPLYQAWNPSLDPDE